MISKEVENLIVKYFSQSANLADLEALNNWLADGSNDFIFKKYVKTHFAITLAMNDPEIDQIREMLLMEIRKGKSQIYSLRVKAFMRYAAIAIIFMGLGFLLQRDDFHTNTDQVIVPRKDDITLQLENGDIKIIAEDGKTKVISSNGKVVVEQKGTQLVYKDDGTVSELAYNTLSIPNGKRFKIMLSDGTHAYLNSGSSLTYPVKFAKDDFRRVSLTGEAYFEVAHDSEHPFVVNVNELNVQVYGTKFNVANYPEDIDTEVVLVEGSVSMVESGNSELGKKEVFLEPGFMGVFDKTQKKITKEKVNTAIYTSWLQGNLVFRNESFENIIQKLERYYNVVIINNNKKLANEKFNATIETEHETIEQVFIYFNKVYQIEYSLVENKIIIN